MIIFTNSQSLTLTSINNTALHTNALHSFAFATLKTQVKIMATNTQAKIPVVDLSNLDLKPGTKTWFSARKDVCHALEELVAEPEICHWEAKRKRKKEMIKIFPYLYYNIHHSC